MISAANVLFNTRLTGALFSTPLRGVPIWYDFTIDYMRHIHVPHPCGAAFGRANRLSYADLSLNRMTIARRKYTPQGGIEKNPWGAPQSIAKITLK